MKNVLFAVVFVLGLGAVAWAAQDAAAAKPATENAGNGLGSVNFTTYAGVAAGVWAAVGFLKGIWKEKLAGKEPLIAMGLAIVIGVTAKLLGAFDGPKTGAESWIGHVIALVSAGIGAGLIHDKIGNPIMKGKPL